MRQVEVALNPLVAGLKTALSSAAQGGAVHTSTAGAVDAGYARELAAQLAKLLTEFDPGAAYILEANQGTLKSLFSTESWEQLTKHAQAYAFTECQALVEKVVANFSAG